MLSEFDLPVLAVALIVGAFVMAGTVKGAIGAGLPMFAVPTIALVLDPALAVALTIVPVMVANVWQTIQGGHYREAIRRFWPFLLFLIIGVIAGAQILATSDPRKMALVLGGIVVGISAMQLVVGALTVPERVRPWLNPIAGSVCGVFAGASGMFAPTVVYSAALRLPKDLYISLLALIALCGTMPLYASLAVNGVLRWSELAVSAIAVAPVLLGMAAGKWIRDNLSQGSYERMIYVALCVIGLNLIYKGLS